MSNANSEQIKAIATLCSMLKISKDDKETMVQGFSTGRCTSSKDLTMHEALLLIQHLNEELPQQDKRKMIGKIFYYCHEMGWTKKNERGKNVADGKRFDLWAVNNSYLKKKLNHYSYKELPKLVSQVELVYKAFLNKS